MDEEVKEYVKGFNENWEKVNADMLKYVNKQLKFTKLWQDPKTKPIAVNYRRSGFDKHAASASVPLETHISNVRAMLARMEEDLAEEHPIMTEEERTLSSTRGIPVT